MTCWSARNERRSGSVMLWDNLPIKTEDDRGDLRAAGLWAGFEPTGIVPSRPICSLRITVVTEQSQRLSAEPHGRVLGFLAILLLCWCCSPVWGGHLHVVQGESSSPNPQYGVLGTTIGLAPTLWPTWLLCHYQELTLPPASLSESLRSADLRSTIADRPPRGVLRIRAKTNTRWQLFLSVLHKS